MNREECLPDLSDMTAIIEMETDLAAEINVFSADN